MTRFLLFIAALFTATAQAQNLVPNGSFEQHSSLPTAVAQWTRVVGWDNVSGDSLCHTPDYYHTDANPGSGVRLPFTQYGTIQLPEGFGAMGLLTYMTSSPEYREYISTQLSQPLIPGGIYNLSFKVALGADPFHGGASNNIGAALSVGPLEQRCVAGASNVIPFAPVHENTNVVLSYDWTEQTYTFTVWQPYDRITIGNFHDDAGTTMQALDSNDYTPGTYYGHYGGYYFIDDVRLEYEGMSGIDNPNQNGIALAQNPVDQMLQLDLSYTASRRVVMSDKLGRLVYDVSTKPFENFLQIETQDLSSGLYDLQVLDESRAVTRFKVVVLH